jgi:type IV pilus assembly protein PilW
MFKRSIGTVASRRLQRGMSLPEILAAALIGLIGMVVIMQVYTVSEERKRTTTGTSDAQINGSLALFSLQAAIRSSGYGLVSPNTSMLGCTTVAYNSDRPTSDFRFLMAPVVIAPGGTDFNLDGFPVGVPDDTSDQIRVTYGSSQTLVEGVKFATGASLDADYTLENAAGWLIGDFAVAQQPGVNCSLVEVTDIVGKSLKHETAKAYTYNVGLAVINRTAKYNKGGGPGPAYTSNANLFSMGRAPTVTTYRVVNDKLQVNTLIPYVPSDVDIGDAIIQLKALYGKDTSATPDGVPDVWNDVQPADPVQWAQVIAIRIALLARSAKLEKTPITPECNWPNFPAGPFPEANSPHWSGGCFKMTNLPDNTNWRNYRYRVYESVVPLRNMLWSQ